MHYIFGLGWVALAGALLCVVGDVRVETRPTRNRLAIALTLVGAVLIWIALHAAGVV